MRVVAGDLRGRRIEGPAGEATRPTTDKVREAVFNALNSMGVLRDATVVDLFAGSGALGIESLSRGAARCVFVESNRSALAVLKENLKTLNVESSSKVVVLDIAAHSSAARLRELVESATLVLADPPYEYKHWNDLFSVIDAGAPDDVLVVAETERRATLYEAPPEGWKLMRERTYGHTRVGFFTRAEGDINAGSPISDVP